MLSEAGRYAALDAAAIVARANYVRINECLIPFACVEAPLLEPVHCMNCGKVVSGVDPELGLVVRAWIECPECLEQSAAAAAEDA